MRITQKHRLTVYPISYYTRGASKTQDKNFEANSKSLNHIGCLLKDWINGEQ